MQGETSQKQAPVRAAKKNDGWREREEARNSSVAPRKTDASTQSPLIRC